MGFKTSGFFFPLPLPFSKCSPATVSTVTNAVKVSCPGLSPCLRHNVLSLEVASVYRACCNIA